MSYGLHSFVAIKDHHMIKTRDTVMYGCHHVTTLHDYIFKFKHYQFGIYITDMSYRLLQLKTIT